MEKYQYKRVLFIVMVVMTMLLVGCTNNNESESEKDETKEGNISEQGMKDKDAAAITEAESKNDEQLQEVLKFLEAPAAPKTMAEIAHYPPTPFGGQYTKQSLSDEMKAELDQFPALPNGYDEELSIALYNKLLTLFAWEYPDWNQVIKDWEMDLFGMPEFEDPRYQFKENFNVEIILDVSGSMKEKIGGKTKFDLAREAIKQFTSSMPKEANLSLRVYGHVGGGKENSCNSIERVYGMKPYSANEFNTVLNQLQPDGWTPLAKALDEARKDMAHLDGETNTNFIYFVSDGIETCGGDPVRAAKEIAKSNIQPLVHIIGFDVPSDEQQQLMDMAQAAEGVYASARNQQELIVELERVKHMAEKWEEWKDQSISQAKKVMSARETELLKLVGNTSRAVAEYNRFFDAADYLYKQGKINEQIKRNIKNRADKRKKFIRTNLDQFLKEAKQLNNSSYQEAKKLVEDMYNQNINQFNN